MSLANPSPLIPVATGGWRGIASPSVIPAPSLPSFPRRRESISSYPRFDRWLARGCRPVRHSRFPLPSFPRRRESIPSYPRCDRWLARGCRPVRHSRPPPSVIPVKTGIQEPFMAKPALQPLASPCGRPSGPPLVGVGLSVHMIRGGRWIPACAGMTDSGGGVRGAGSALRPSWIPACAGMTGREARAVVASVTGGPGAWGVGFGV